MKNKLILLSISLMLCCFLNSCMTTKTSVGAFKETQGNTYTYAKGKQVWLLWGIFPMGRTNVSTPTNGSCQVITRLNGVDFLISGITGGIVITETIKVEAKK